MANQDNCSSKRRKFIRVFGALPLLVASPILMAAEASKREKQAEIRKMASSTLRRLYKVQPRSRQAISRAAGYAVFSNFGMKLFFAGGGSGEGLVVVNDGKTEIFMKMFELQAGLGFGIKKFSLIFVFETSQVIEEFVNSGWEFGGQATAAAKYEENGKSFEGALSVAPGIWLYQLTQSGLALELTAKGTKYYKDVELN